jgi:hypothetical protein
MFIDCYYESAQCHELVDGVYVMAAIINAALMFYFMFQMLNLSLNSRHKALLAAMLTHMKKSGENTVEDGIVIAELEQISRKLRLE